MRLEIAGWTNFRRVAIIAALIQDGTYGIRLAVMGTMGDQFKYVISHVFEVKENKKQSFLRLYQNLCAYFDCAISGPEALLMVEGFLQDGHNTGVMYGQGEERSYAVRNRFPAFLNILRNALSKVERAATMAMLNDLGAYYSRYTQSDFGRKMFPVPRTHVYLHGIDVTFTGVHEHYQ